MCLPNLMYYCLILNLIEFDYCLGADLNIQTLDGDSLLHYAVNTFTAARRNSTCENSFSKWTTHLMEMLMLLVRYGADCHLKNGEGRTVADVLTTKHIPFYPKV